VDFTQIRLAVADGIATITLSRPDKLNAFTGTMMTELIAAFDATDANDAVRAVIVTGDGRAFCAGADLSAGGATFDYEALGSASPVRADGTTDYGHDAVRDGGGRVTLRIFASLKPVIAAINGPAVGIGATMLLTSASLPTPRASASSSPGVGSSPKPRRAGSCRASSASPGRSNGASPAGCSTPPRRSAAASSAVSSPPPTCWPKRPGSPARSPTTPRRCRSR